MESVNHKTLKSILFDVEKVESKVVSPGYETPNKNAHSIVGYIGANRKIRLHDCGEYYNLIRNQDVIVPLVELLEKKFKDLQIRVINEENTQFDVSIAPRKGKAIVGEILPRFQFSNSYNGVVKAHLSGGLYRTWCENGAAVPVEGKNMKYTFKHNDKNIFVLEEIEMVVESFLQTFPKLEVEIQKMKKAIIPTFELKKHMEEISKGTGFPVKGMTTAIERAVFESEKFDEKLSIWLAYNGLNYVLNHDRTYLIAQHVRNNMDEKLFTNALELASA